MRVFLGNPPWRIGNRYGVRAGSRWPFTQEIEKGIRIPGYIPFPFYLAYASAVLERTNIEVNLIDAIAEGQTNEEFLAEVEKFKPDLILLESSTPSIFNDLAIAKKIKDQIEPEIALCGPHVSVLGEMILKNNSFINYILVGEYEYTLLELVNFLEKNQKLKDVLGLIYRDDERIKSNRRRPSIENLDELPWPARHFLPMYNYNDAFAGMPIPNVQMWASRGCPFQCIFCMWPQVMYGGHKYRTRDPINVVDEMEWLINYYKFKSVYFDDDTFNIGKERILRLCAEIKKRKIDIPWAVMARGDTCDKEMLNAMESSGLYAIKYGVESGDQGLVKRSGKNLDLNKVRETVKLTKKLGVKVHLTFSFGLPGETKKTVQKTIDYARELDPDSVQFSICTPFPGTKYFEWADKNGLLLTKDWSKYDGACSAVIKTESMSKEDLEKAWKRANDAWSNHKLRKNFRERPLEYIGKGLKHPIKGVKELWRVIK